MEKRKYSVIVFDLGNVLIPFDYDIIIRRLNEIDVGLGDKFYTLYKDNYHIYRQFEKWELTTEEFIEIVLNWLDRKVTSEEFCIFYSELFTLNEEVISLLPALKKNYKLVLLSNTNYIHKKYGWEKYEFLKQFDKLILSHEVGAIKPEEKIYRAVEEFTHLPPAETLFIDDIAEYVEGAKKMGWDAIQFFDSQKLIKDFEDRGISIT